MKTEDMDATPPNAWMPETDPRCLAVLGKLGEESSELSSKANRCIIQGIDESEPETGVTNRQALEDEIADVLANIHRTVEFFDLDKGRMSERIGKKLEYYEAWDKMIQDSVDGKAQTEEGT